MIISTISKRLKMDTWRSDVFFSVGEAATSKSTHGEVAVFGSTVYRIFAFKCQKLRTPLALLAPCVMKTHGWGCKNVWFSEFLSRLYAKEEKKRFFLSNPVGFPCQPSFPTPVSLFVIPTKRASLCKASHIKYKERKSLLLKQK